MACSPRDFSFACRCGVVVMALVEVAGFSLLLPLPSCRTSFQSLALCPGGAAIAGIFYIFVVILVIVVKAVLGSIPEMLGAATSSAIPSAEEISKNEEKACVLCSWYDNSSEQCLLLKKHTDRYGGDAYACSNYENR